MLNWIRALWAGKPTPRTERPTAPPITPAMVEAAIDAAGRDEVFALARVNGWTVANPPPLWVWNQLAAEVRRSKDKPTVLH